MAAGVAGTSQKAKYNPHVPVRIVGSKQNFLYSLDSHLPHLSKAAPFQEEYKIFQQTSSHQWYLGHCDHRIHSLLPTHYGSDHYTWIKRGLTFHTCHNSYRTKSLWFWALPTVQFTSGHNAAETGQSLECNRSNIEPVKAHFLSENSCQLLGLVQEFRGSGTHSTVSCQLLPRSSSLPLPPPEEHSAWGMVIEAFFVHTVHHHKGAIADDRK